MSRLTKAIKEEIYNNICFEKINKVRNGHKADFRKLCQEVVEDWLLTEYSKTTLSWIKNSPTGGLPLLSNIRVKIIDSENKITKEIDSRNNKDNKKYYRAELFSLINSKKVLSQDMHKEDFRIEQDTVIGIKFLTKMKEVDALEKYEGQLKVTIFSALNSCTTEKQLSDNYPDLVQYVPKPVQVAKLPALTNKEVLSCLKGSC